MSAPFDHAPPEDTPRERAVAWCVRLSSDAAVESDWLAFEAWLAESPDNQTAYDAVEAVWNDLEEAVAAPPARVVPLKARPSRRPAVWLSAIAASLLVAIALGILWWTAAPATQTFDTAPGERREIALADSTRITLNGGSHITARLGRSERRVIMADAEAAFDVAKDPRRPFLIEAGDREIRVVGTEFNVLRHAGEVRVTVRRGVVEVRPTGNPGAPPLARLEKGHALTHKEGLRTDVVLATDPAPAFAWTEGRLVFRGEPLSEVAGTLNRYVPTPITVAPNARNLPVTATLELGHEDQMLKTLSAFLPVQVERHPDSVRLSLRRQTR